MRLSIFSCAFWPFVCLGRNVYLDLPIFWLGCLILSCMSYLYILEVNLIGCFICKYFIPFWEFFFHLIYGFLCCAKAFKFSWIPLIYFCFYFHYSSSVQFSHSVVSNYLQSHGLQHTRPPCPSPTPGVYLNSCLLSWWCHPTISSSIISSSRLQSYPASGSFHYSRRWVKKDLAVIYVEECSVYVVL